MKKVLSWVLAAVFVCGVLLQSAVPVSAAPGGVKLQKIKDMNGLLNGISGDILDDGDVATWSDDTINEILCQKMMWDDYLPDPWLPTMGISTDMYSDGYIHVPRDLVDQLTLDTFGREFVPVEKSNMLKLSGDEVLFGVAAGEHSRVVVQDYIQQGSYYIAVGCIAYFGGAGSEVDGYIQATFRENSDSMYGMTLVSLKEIDGNQSFRNVGAEASSVLSGGNYRATNVLDGKKDTAWVEGASGTGVGEFIELFSDSNTVMHLCALEIDPGYHKSNDILTKNGWPTKIRIETDDGVTLEEYCYSTDTQTYLFETPVDIQWMRITIVEAQSGSKYTDTCISEIRLKGIDTEAYFQNTTISLPEEEAPVATTPPVAVDAPAPDDVAKPDAPAPDDVAEPDAPADTEPVTTPAEDVPDTETEAEEQDEKPVSDREIILLGNMGDWDIDEFLEDNLLLIILVGAGSLVVAAGVAVLIILLRKKK